MPTFRCLCAIVAGGGLTASVPSHRSALHLSIREGFKKDQIGIELKRATGARVDILSRDEISQLEPALARTFVKAHYIESHGHCKNPGQLVKGLAAQFIREGGKLIKQRVRSIDVNDGVASRGCHG